MLTLGHVMKGIGLVQGQLPPDVWSQIEIRSAVRTAGSEAGR